MNCDGQTFFNISSWYYFITLFGFLFSPIAKKVVPHHIDFGFSLSKILGISLIFYINYFFVHLGIAATTAPWFSISLIISLLFILYDMDEANDILTLLQIKLKKIFLSEAIFFLTFIAVLLIYALHPELYWGEKPMDMGLLQSALRSTNYPIEDYGFAKEPSLYYTYSYSLYASLAKMTGVQSINVYGLSLATAAALLCTNIFSFLQYKIKNSVVAFLGSLAIFLGGNYAAFYLGFIGKKSNLSAFWNSTRLFKDGAFAEYPSWSFLFGDLHAHVTGYAFGVLYITLMFYVLERLFFKPISLKSNKVLCFFLALAYGLLIAINGWDFILYSLLCFYLCLFYAVIFYQKLKENFSNIFLFIGIHLFGILLFSPTLLELMKGVDTQKGFWNGEWNSLSSYFFHQGHWWLLCGGLLLLNFLIFKRRWSTLVNSMAFLGAIGAMYLTAELFFYGDKINTIFKSLTNTYLWLGLVSFSLLRPVLRLKNRSIKIATLSIMTILLTPIFLGSFSNGKIVLTSRLQSNQVGLDGRRFLLNNNPELFGAIEFVRENVLGMPTVLERYSSSFDYSSNLLSSFTGIPSYLGWERHSYLRGHSWANIYKRKRDIDFVYQSSDPMKVHEFLIKEKIPFLIVGKFERNHYQRKDLEKFREYRSLFVPIYRNEGTTLYGIGDFNRYLLKR